MYGFVPRLNAAVEGGSQYDLLGYVAAMLLSTE
jgi:hypothetical protein